MTEVTHLLCINLGIAVIVFALAWALSLAEKNYGFLDVTWTLSIGLLAFVDGLRGSGNVTRRVLFTLAGVAWSLRLGLFVLARVLRHHPTEDKRYRTLRERWKSPGAFFAFFELQAMIAVAFSAPFLTAAIADEPHVSVIEWLGLLVVATGIVGEAVADAQAQAFKKRADSRNALLKIGLWRYSRHPNYFFEILTWLGFALAALPLPVGWVAIVCPILIIYFLLRVTGVPLTEKHSIESHGEAYLEYQRTTSAIIPRAPKTRGPS